MSREIVLVQGGGVGLDEEAAVRRIVAAAGVDVRWRVFEAGQAAMDKGLPPLPPAMLEAVRGAGRALKTKLLNPPGSHDTNYNVTLRRALELFASVRPLRNLEGVPARFHNVDILLVREITEDLYTAGEHEIVPGVVQSIKVVTEAACRRVCRFAFALARVEGRKTIHCIHKANILKVTGGLFLSVGREIAPQYPDIHFDDRIVDNMAMQLVLNPHQYDCLVTTNLFGDILSDLMSGLVGGLGLTGAANIGDDCAIFEAVHGTAPDIAGKGLANPTALIRSGEMLLRHVGETAAADALARALHDHYAEGEHLTRDMGGSASTSEFGEKLAERVAGMR